MLMRPLIVAALISGDSPPSIINDARQAPEGWTVVEQPVGDGWRCANYSPQQWTVSGLSPDSAEVSSFKYSEIVRLKLSDGDLVGTNHGEFGGTLEWVAHGSVRRVLIANTNPVAMTMRGKDVFVASGLAHLGPDSGEIIRLRRAEGGSWLVSKVMDLGEAPNAGVRIDDTTWTILTTTGLAKIDLSKLTLQRIYRNENWSLIFGNSIVPLGDSWLIGARRAVIRLNPGPHGYSEEWIVPTQCKRQVGPRCTCEA